MNFMKYAFQDFKRQKAKSIFAVGGVFISILLLTVVGSLADSLSYSYLDQATSQVGSADIVFTRTLEADLNFDPFFDEDIIQNRLQGQIEDIDYFYPRILMFIQAAHNDPTLDNKLVSKQVFFYGIDTVLEQNSNRMGDLWLVDENLTQTEEIFQGPIQPGHCIITKAAAKMFNAKIGENITITYTNNVENVIIDAIVVQDTRFTLVESTLIITELPWAQSFLNSEGKVNYVMATLANREQVYDTRDIAGTTRKLRLVAEEIQEIVGFEYQVTLPKMAQLEVSEQSSMSMTIMFSFLTFFSMLITGILINSILSTSIEERIREFGILRVLGAKKTFTRLMILAQGFLIASVGTLLGTAVGALLAPAFLQWYFGNYVWTQFTSSFTFIILPTTIIQSLAIGIGITTAISIIPALKAGKTTISKAIDPTRKSHGDEYVIKQEGSANVKLMLFGLGIATVGIIIFILFPRIIATGDMTITTSLFIGLLACVLIGMVLACVGFVPILQQLISQVFKPFIKRFHPIYEISLVRYRRRNTGNTVMFALTFAFIFFVSTMLEIRSANTESLLKFQYGSDLVLSNSGSLEANNSIDVALLGELEQLPGIKNIAPILHNSLDVAKAASLLFSITEEGASFSDISFEDIFGSIPKLEARVGDVGDYQDYYCNLISVNQSYYDTIDRRLLMWDEASGSSDESLLTVVEESGTCILAKTFADAMGITELDTMVRLTMYDPEDPSGYQNVSLFRVVGISQGMPGVWNFRSSQINLWIGAGVLLNFEDYTRLMQWGDMDSPDTIVDKVLINLVNNDYDNLKEMQTFIRDYFGEEYKFTIDEAVSKIEYMKETDKTTNTLMQTVLFFSIIVSLFGLVSSMYSTLIERMFEIGIIRAMGMRPYEVRSLLIAEAVTIMLAAGSMGMLIGILIAYLLQTNVALITEMPVIVTVNYVTLASTFLVSLGVSIIGMILITTKVRRWSIMEILRTTF